MSSEPTAYGVEIPAEDEEFVNFTLVDFLNASTLS
jgi:hypothetical protein